VQADDSATVHSTTKLPDRSLPTDRFGVALDGDIHPSVYRQSSALARRAKNKTEAYPHSLRREVHTPSSAPHILSAELVECSQRSAIALLVEGLVVDRRNAAGADEPEWTESTADQGGSAKTEPD
jgi:hypothetical protein